MFPGASSRWSGLEVIILSGQVHTHPHHLHVDCWARLLRCGNAVAFSVTGHDYSTATNLTLTVGTWMPGLPCNCDANHMETIDSFEFSELALWFTFLLGKQVAAMGG